MRKIKPGQSLLEYIIVLTVITAVVLAAAKTIGDTTGGSGLGKLLKNAGSKLDTDTQSVAKIIP